MDEDEITLPADTLKILNEFLHEKAQREQEEQEKIKAKAGTNAHFQEDWQLSQFWYSDQTKQTLGAVVKKLLSQTNSDTDPRIALLSCPSLYPTIKELHKNVNIFEYDRRFAAYGDDFVYYDFNAEANDENHLQSHHYCYDIIIADPPFLSEECISKICRIIARLSKPNAKWIFCSGDVVEKWLTKDLGLRKCSFRPEHERNLGNEFVSYANFNLDDFVLNK